MTAAKLSTVKHHFILFGCHREIVWQLEQLCINYKYSFVLPPFFLYKTTCLHIIAAVRRGSNDKQTEVS
jgi:hypothetical protein